MKTMRAFRFNDSLESPDLSPSDIPIPAPGPGERLIRVHAAGVTPTELVWYPTSHTLEGGARSGAIPGHEFSGVIAAVGPDGSPEEIGRPVFGMNDWFASGATAEFCLAPATALAPKPARLSHAEAAAVPIGALTAWQGLIDRARIRRDERVLIHGGSGAVGVFAIQFAQQAGAYVVTTASPRNFQFLADIGANETMDYRTAKLEDLEANFDVIFDAVGGETLRRSWSLLRPGGRMVTIAADSEGMQDERTKSAFFIVEPNESQLEEIARLLDAGTLRVFVDAEVPMSQAASAYGSRVEGRKGRGKVVLVTDEPLPIEERPT
jgi:NADPH:quinone reductase-like Zn-dependent oxidoreductase